jgi:hypothetical protein
MWTLTALSKLSIRIGQVGAMKSQNEHSQILERIKKNLKDFTTHMNIEIQQRACEFLLILDA